MNEALKRWIFLYSPDGVDGGGAEEEDEGDPAVGTSAFQRALEGRKDGESLARELWDDNYKLRRKNTRLNNRINELTQTTRTDGSVLLTKDEAAEWESYKELGQKPEAIKTAIEERGQLQGQLNGMQREKIVRDAATVAGYDFDVLNEVDTFATKVGGKTLSYEIREIETNGQKVKTAFVKDGTDEKPLTQYAQENWAKHLPSLVVKQDSGSGQNQGTFYPSQHQGSDGNRPTTAKQQTEATLNKQYASRTDAKK